MGSPGPVVIGTRGSALALAQAKLVRDALLARWPELDAQVLAIRTTGDMLPDVPLSAVGGQGIFVREIERALREGRVDLAVHSAKDLPSRLPTDLPVAAFPVRADPRDVLVSRAGGLRELPPGARVGTSSARRVCQLRALRPDLTLVDIRGNVDTRLRRLAAREYDAVVLAAAGLIRLGLAHVVTEWFSPDDLIPAVSQGALAVQVRADDAERMALVAPLDHAPTATAVTAERGFLARLGAGCAAAVAAHATLGHGGGVSLAALIGGPEGRAVRGTRTGPAAQAAAVGEALATALLDAGGAALLDQAGHRAGASP